MNGDIRSGDGRGFGESGVPQTFGDGGSHETVVLPRLVGEPEETEEDDDAKDGGPSGGLEQVDKDWGLVHDDPGELEDTRVSPVGISPGDPRANLRNSGICDDSPDGNGDGDAKIEGSQSDETPVPAVGQIGVGTDEIPELLASPHEGADGED